ncbi:type II toxin-antitoxin system HicB family antitoxin [Thermococcus peptonophilus]|uniref:type II toxin-antitoxin system HicB family antitoxin n=1 Tax=Thermococcus peptonophilus TaxID=53952 RepID=UPI000AF0865B
MNLHAVIWEEEGVYVVKEVFTGVTTQGETIEEALENLREAVELYLEEFPPELKEELGKIKFVGDFNVEIAKLSGEEVVKVLTSKFGFRVSRQRGQSRRFS